MVQGLKITSSAGPGDTKDLGRLFFAEVGGPYGPISAARAAFMAAY